MFTVNWSAVFEVPATGSTGWTRIDVPFTDFIPTWLGNLTEAGNMDLTNVKDIAISQTMFDHIVGSKTVAVEKYAPGDFELKFKDIRAYGTGDKVSRDKK